MLSNALAGLIDFLFPKALQVYELESLSPGELVRKLPNAPAAPDGAIAVFAYANPRVRELVWELKYRKNMHIAESLSAILLDVLRSELAERALFENFTEPLLIPIPTSLERRLSRGWNQTEVLCENIYKLDTEHIFEYAPAKLRKVRHTESQTLSLRKERLENLEGSMEASGVEGRNVVLLDDVTTTGATFKEARRALRAAGSKRVLCIALAH